MNCSRALRHLEYETGILFQTGSGGISCRLLEVVRRGNVLNFFMLSCAVSRWTCK